MFSSYSFSVDFIFLLSFCFLFSFFFPELQSSSSSPSQSTLLHSFPFLSNHNDNNNIKNEFNDYKPNHKINLNQVLSSFSFDNSSLPLDINILALLFGPIVGNGSTCYYTDHTVYISPDSFYNYSKSYGISQGVSFDSMSPFNVQLELSSIIIQICKIAINYYESPSFSPYRNNEIKSIYRTLIRIKQQYQHRIQQFTKNPNLFKRYSLIPKWWHGNSLDNDTALVTGIIDTDINFTNMWFSVLPQFLFGPIWYGFSTNIESIYYKSTQISYPVVTIGNITFSGKVYDACQQDYYLAINGTMPITYKNGDDNDDDTDDNSQFLINRVVYQNNPPHNFDYNELMDHINNSPVLSSSDKEYVKYNTVTWYESIIESYLISLARSYHPSERSNALAEGVIKILWPSITKLDKKNKKYNYDNITFPYIDSCAPTFCLKTVYNSDDLAQLAYSLPNGLIISLPSFRPSVGGRYPLGEVLQYAIIRHLNNKNNKNNNDNSIYLDTVMIQLGNWNIDPDNWNLRVPVRRKLNLYDPLDTNYNFTSMALINLMGLRYWFDNPFNTNNNDTFPLRPDCCEEFNYIQNYQNYTQYNCLPHSETIVVGMVNSDILNENNKILDPYQILSNGQFTKIEDTQYTQNINNNNNNNNNNNKNENNLNIVEYSSHCRWSYFTGVCTHVRPDLVHSSVCKPHNSTMFFFSAAGQTGDEDIRININSNDKHNYIHEISINKNNLMYNELEYAMDHYLTEDE